MRRTPLRERGRRNRREPDRLADKSAPGLFKNQGELGEAEPKAIRGLRDKDAKPSEFSRLKQPRRREASSCSRNPRATFGPAAAMNFAALSRNKVCSDVRCRSMTRLLYVSSGGSERGGPRRCAGFPMNRRRSSRAAPDRNGVETSTSPKSVAIGSFRRRVTARRLDQQLVERLQELGAEDLDDR